MALLIGTVAADTGLTKDIFVQLDALLSPPLQEAVDAATPEAKPGAQLALDKARIGWRNLAFAIATGVVNHLVTNLEVREVSVAGTVNVPVSGNTGTTTPAGPHLHTVSLTPSVSVTLAQNNSGTGRVL